MVSFEEALPYGKAFGGEGLTSLSYVKFALIPKMSILFSLLMTFLTYRPFR